MRSRGNLAANKLFTIQFDKPRGAKNYWAWKCDMILLHCDILYFVMTGKMDQPNPLFENAMMPLTSQVATNVKPIPKEEVTTITTLQNCGEI